MNVLDAWAIWRYGLDKVADADTAWQVFRMNLPGSRRTTPVPDAQRCRPGCRAAPTETAERSPAGSGDPSDQKHWLVRLFQVADERSAPVWIQPAARRSPSCRAVSSGSSGGRIGVPQLGLDGYPVAHAVWLLYETHPTIVQERIVPETVALAVQGESDRPATGCGILRRAGNRSIPLAAELAGRATSTGVGRAASDARSGGQQVALSVGPSQRRCRS